jgi:hypothetical protein
VKKLWLIIAVLFAAAVLAQTPVPDAVRFKAVDIYVDSGDKPLAAYQLEFKARSSSVRIVGVEGGEHPAFRDAPYYDLKAIQHERVIIAAFSTDAANKLPKGRMRVATIHLQSVADDNAGYELKLTVSADDGGKKFEAKATCEERKQP